MKRLFLLSLLTVTVLTVAAENPPTYLGLKAKFKNMPLKESKTTFIKKQAFVGAAAGLALFAINEYRSRSHEDVFGHVLPYLTLAYVTYQTFNIIIGKSLDVDLYGCGKNNGLTVSLF